MLGCVVILLSTALDTPKSEASSPLPVAGSITPSPRIHPSVFARFSDGDDSAIIAWVFFGDDKGFKSPLATARAIQQTTSTYNPRALQRRRLRRTQPGLLDFHDLPVHRSFVQGVRQTGSDVRVISRWLNGVSVRATRAQIEAIAQLGFVSKIQPVLRSHGITPMHQQRMLTDTQGGGVAGGFYGEAQQQLDQINLPAVHTAGYTGSGVVIGILDTGFQRTHDAFNEADHELSVVAEFDFVDDDSVTSVETGDPFGQHWHGTWILGTIGAYKPNSLVGAAYDASFILCKTEDTTQEVQAEEDYYVAGLEFIEANGGDIATASLGYIDWYTQEDLDGLTAVTTIAVNIATTNGVFCVNAAGNGGNDTDRTTSNLLAPADALEVLTCGGVNSLGETASFSSDGPTNDGRLKPEVLARAVNTRTVSADNDTTYVGVNGTSLSTPLVAGAVACLIQAHPDWTVQQLRGYLMYTATDYTASGITDPDFVRGFGVIDALAAVNADCNNTGIADAEEIANQESSDCNANGIPDECEPDCNANGVPDDCDVIANTSPDCNGNGIPDSCDIVNQHSVDANDNGIPDECLAQEGVPAISTWGMIVLGAGLVFAGNRRLQKGFNAHSPAA